jgi:lipoprotein-releasing system ATP-binding protein
MDEVLIRTVGITKDYGEPVKTRVLFGIDLEIPAGEFTCLVGASGSGKSTLLNIIGALDPPTGGQVIIDGTYLSNLNEDQLAYFRNRTMGFIFQSHFLLPQFTVLENVLIPYRIYAGHVPEDIRQRALDLLDRVGISNRKDNRANAISGGEQQRVAIARALINEPRMILADEPTGNLDSTNTKLVFAMLRDINRDHQTTFVMVTHDMHLAMQADRLLELKDGLIINDRDLRKEVQYER